MGYSLKTDGCPEFAKKQISWIDLIKPKDMTLT